MTTFQEWLSVRENHDPGRLLYQLGGALYNPHMYAGATTSIRTLMDLLSKTKFASTPEYQKLLAYYNSDPIEYGKMKDMVKVLEKQIPRGEGGGADLGPGASRGYDPQGNYQGPFRNNILPPHGQF